MPQSFVHLVNLIEQAIAVGPGAGHGSAVFSGMLGVTVFGIFFTPVFYAVVMWFVRR